jgi:hypothetical protein
MSQLALSILKKLQADRNGQIVLLLILSIGITLWGTNNIVTADTLFQSSPVPAEESSPLPEPTPDQQPPAEEPSQPEPSAEQPLPSEPLPAPEFAPPPEPDRNDFPPQENPEPQSPRNFILDQVELIDTVVVSGAYVWLCCGVGLFLLIPIFLLVIYIRGRSKIQKQEDMFG